MWPRWVRAISTIWVAFDSHKRGKLDVLWTLVVLLLGPLFVPFYIAQRKAVKGDNYIDCYWWRLFKAIENLFLSVVGLASSAVFIENITTPKSKDLAEVKRAEIKAGSIMGAIAMFILIGLAKFGSDFVKEEIEKRFFNK